VEGVKLLLCGGLLIRVVVLRAVLVRRKGLLPCPLREAHATVVDSPVSENHSTARSTHSRCVACFSPSRWVT
jgi:hypothetical protein